MARLPGIDAVTGSLLSVLTAQAEALAALPETVRSLASAVTGLVEAAGQARETVATLSRLAERAERVVDELEEPLLALKPGLVRLGKVLDDPVVDQLPDTLRQIQADVLPVLRTLSDTQQRVAFIAGQTERIMAFVDETSRTLAGFPGAGLLGRRRPGWRPGEPPTGPGPTGPTGTGPGSAPPAP